jgi:hypothetical protein
MAKLEKSARKKTKAFRKPFVVAEFVRIRLPRRDTLHGGILTNSATLLVT